jgi:hypothetical protein
MNYRLQTVCILLGLALLVGACTLSQEAAQPATPTAPAFVTPVPDGVAPTMFPSVTPLTGGAPAVEGFAPTDAIPEMLDGRPCPIPVGWVQYTLQGGDTLGDLAQQTDSSVNDLVTANCLENADSILSGQVIYLPREPLAG